jgi:hypothetical protein
MHRSNSSSSSTFRPFSTVEISTPDQEYEGTPTPEDWTAPTQEPGSELTPTAETGVQTTPVPGSGQKMLQVLEQANVPTADLVELAGRLKGIEGIPATETPLAAPLTSGAHQQFWASNVDDNTNFKVSATLRYVSPHLYFWVEDSVNYDAGALKTLGDTFETKIYPKDREFFGSEWSPGIDDDVHLYILLAKGLGQNLAGYYSSADEYDPKAHPYSNAHEMFMLNADNIRLDEDFTKGVLAHEFQHMIHWNDDRNEESWMNEGFSEVAAFLNGYDLGGFDSLYMQDPDLQLNDWPNDENATSPHYGAGFLFLDYFLNRFGDKVTKDLVANPLNGLEAVDDTLQKDGMKDASTGKPVTADSVFGDWAVTNYLLDKNVGDGRYTYANYPDAPQATPGVTIKSCPAANQQGDVHQYGVDYIQINCHGTYTLNFSGSTDTKVLPVQPASGSYAFWSNKGDESDMTLDHSFDFTTVSSPIQLKYSTWYDLEENYDFVYLEARADGGVWKIIQTQHSTDNNTSGNSYGWGYTGKSTGWIQEQVDLSAYAGKKVDLRFEYITDAAVNGEGFLLDDVSIPAANYQTDFEKDDGGWQGNGFVRLENDLPQTYKVSLILQNGQTSVQTIDLDANQKASLPVTIDGDAVLVVSGTTRFTRQVANYQFSLTK